jgi:glucokinase
MNEGAVTFVVISGLPGSGKTTLGRRLAGALELALIDKDDILDGLFASKGIGDVEWRRALSRESDGILRAAALASNGAVLVSHWRIPGMPAESGTPTDWLKRLPGNLVHVRCSCPPQIAAQRFARRHRHQGHLDDTRSAAETLASITALAALTSLDLQPIIDVDTSDEPDIEDLLRRLQPWLK